MDKITEYNSVKNPKITATINVVIIAIVLILFVLWFIYGFKSLNGIPLLMILIINIRNIFYPINSKYITNVSHLVLLIL